MKSVEKRTIDGVEYWVVYSWDGFASFHREDGPAIVYLDGEKEYYLNDKQVNLPEGALFAGIIGED